MMSWPKTIESDLHIYYLPPLATAEKMGIQHGLLTLDALPVFGAPLTANRRHEVFVTLRVHAKAVPKRQLAAGQAA